MGIVELNFHKLAHIQSQQVVGNLLGLDPVIRPSAVRMFHDFFEHPVGEGHERLRDGDAEVHGEAVVRAVVQGQPTVVDPTLAVVPGLCKALLGGRKEVKARCRLARVRNAEGQELTWLSNSRQINPQLPALDRGIQRRRIIRGGLQPQNLDGLDLQLSGIEQDRLQVGPQRGQIDCYLARDPLLVHVDVEGAGESPDIHASLANCLLCTLWQVMAWGDGC